ncbi:MAG: SDR family oxidoreductase [Bacteroidota bacterium]|nr:SDR family oxidoreductase [Bacteroidota bacterium]
MSKVVLITGISSGFGKQTAEYLAHKGYKVYGTSRRKIDHDPLISLLTMEVTDVVSVQKAVDEILQKEGHLDVLINNAGMGISGAIEEVSEDEAKLQMDTNFYGALHTIQAVLPVMRKHGSGTIINTSSIGGLMGLPFQGFYSASKFAIEGLSEALRMELKEFNIDVVLVNPGDFQTNFTANRKIIAKAGENSPYQKQFSKSLAVIEKDENGGLLPIVLAKKIHSIIEKKNPRPQYVVATFEQKLAVWLKYLLPQALFFKILGDHYGIK